MKTRVELQTESFNFCTAQKYGRVGLAACCLPVALSLHAVIIPSASITQGRDPDGGLVKTYLWIRVFHLRRTN